MDDEQFRKQYFDEADGMSQEDCWSFALLAAEMAMDRASTAQDWAAVSVALSAIVNTWNKSNQDAQSA